ncbi:MAG: hypothetical protein WCH07_03925 [Deltaproteobacteria bacterium]
MPVHGKDYENLTISIPQPLSGDLFHVARQSGHFVSQLTEKALVQYLKDERGINAVYLSAPVNAMLKGFYEENTMLGDLKKHGDYGGHLHECQTERVHIGIQFIQRLKLDLPITIDYLTANLPR